MAQLSAPIFSLGDRPALKIEDSYIRPIRYDGLYAMAGPSEIGDPACLPVRGDLAHIALAGRYFVPHYAVPMPFVTASATTLRAAGRDDSNALRELPAGARFDVLDISGNWAWGQLGENGLVGYVPMSALVGS